MAVTAGVIDSGSCRLTNAQSLNYTRMLSKKRNLSTSLKLDENSECSSEEELDEYSEISSSGNDDARVYKSRRANDDAEEDALFERLWRTAGNHNRLVRALFLTFNYFCLNFLFLGERKRDEFIGTYCDWWRGIQFNTRFDGDQFLKI